MKISVENTATHVQTLAVKHFSLLLAAKLKNRIDIRFFSNAALFRDKHVIDALKQGKIEMAVPGTWHVDRFEPNVGIFLMPMFYGRPPEFTHQVLDSTVGKTINNSIEKRLGLKVIGKWIDLGHAHLFSISRPITNLPDLNGMRIRVAGGKANILRIQLMGANPMTIPWPDLPEYLLQERVDAILTSYETIRSAKLWEKGIRYAFEDREYFPQYIPLIRMSFWKKLPSDIQQTILSTWNDHADIYRENAARAQEKAKRLLIENGIHIVVPTESQRSEWRKELLKQQNQMAAAMHISPALLDQIMDQAD